MEKIEQWLNEKERKMRGCTFRIHKNVMTKAVQDQERFQTVPFDLRLFCNALDLPALFYCEDQQLLFGSVLDLIHLYVTLKEKGKGVEDDWTVWLYFQGCPLVLWDAPPSVERIMNLFLNHPSDINPAKTLVTGIMNGVPMYRMVKEALMEKLAFSNDHQKKADAYFDECWLLCINSDRSSHHRTSTFRNNIALNDHDMVIPMDNIGVMHTMDVMRRLMDYFHQPGLIDMLEDDGIHYACLSKEYYGPFFMIMHGISFLNRSRLPVVFRSHPICSLAHYYDRYEHAFPFATSAWLFAFLESTWPRTGIPLQFRPVCSDIRVRIATAIAGAEAIHLKRVLRDMYQKPILHLAPFSDMVQTLHCALMEPRWHDHCAPADFVIVIRSTLLRAIVNNLPFCSLNEAWKRALLEAANALHPTDLYEISYLELPHYGAHICAALWNELMDLMCGRKMDLHPAWKETLHLIPQYGFRMELGKKSTLTFHPLTVPASMDCFLEHASEYSTTELVLRLFEVCWCSDCGKKKCNHLLHDKRSRENVDLCEETVDSPLPYGQSSTFSVVDHWAFYLFRGVSDPSLAQRMLARIPLQSLTLVCH